MRVEEKGPIIAAQSQSSKGVVNMIHKWVNKEEDVLVDAFRLCTTRQREMLMRGALAASTKRQPHITLAAQNPQKSDSAEEQSGARALPHRHLRAVSSE